MGMAPRQHALFFFFMIAFVFVRVPVVMGVIMIMKFARVHMMPAMTIPGMSGMQVPHMRLTRIHFRLSRRRSTALYPKCTPRM